MSDVFKREPQYFDAMGQTFKLEFIPSEHFSSLLAELLALGVQFGSDQTIDLKADEIQIKVDSFTKAAKNATEQILKNQIFELMADVIIYQNETVNKAITASVLRKNVSVLDMSKFIALLITHPEILAAVEVFVESAGKLLEIIPGKIAALKEKLSPSVMERFTPSSDTTSTTTESPSTKN